MQYAPYDGWVKRETPLELFYPRDAAQTTTSAGATADLWSAWTQIVASTSGDFSPFGVHANTKVTSVATGTVLLVYDIQIGIGAAAAEIPIAHFTDSVVPNVSNPGASTTAFIVYGRLYSMGPTVIPSGSRLAVRIRMNQKSANYALSVTIYLAGYDNVSVPPFYPAYSYRAHLAGIHKSFSQVLPVQLFSVTPGFPLGTYGSWVETIASAPSDLLIIGISRGQSTSSAQGVYIELGTGAASSEVVRGRLASPGGVLANGNLQVFRIPIFVPKGERVAIRASGQNTIAISCKLLYEQLSGTTTSTSTSSTSSSTSTSTTTTA